MGRSAAANLECLELPISYQSLCYRDKALKNIMALYGTTLFTASELPTAKQRGQDLQRHSALVLRKGLERMPKSLVPCVTLSKAQRV